MKPSSVLLAALAAPTITQAQSQAPLQVQTNTFNSSFRFTPAQIAAAQLTPQQAADLTTIYNSDASQLANGGPAADAFYSLPPNTSLPSKPGVLLKAQAVTNTTPFANPPNTALSRIIYTSENLNGSVVPASALVLWPYVARSFPGIPSRAAPVVLWTHGTSGFFAPAAPSANRQLYYQYDTIFSLAVQGYAVVAPDYAGLGFARNLTSGSSNPIPHQYLASPASAKDALYGLQAAQRAFAPRLSNQFVTFGHSQGGGVAWAVAEALAANPSLGPGSLGTIAASPTTTAIPTNNFVLAFVSFGIRSVFPSFNASTWLTPLGVARANLYRDIQGSVDLGLRLFNLPGAQILQPRANETWAAQAYNALTAAGNKPVRGPLLVTQGTNDSFIPYAGTVARVKETCAAFPGNDIALVVANGTAHSPSLPATHQVWAQWIADRFAGVPLAKHACGATRVLDSFLPYDQYRRYDGSFLQWVDAPQFDYQSFLAM